jgi:hypothetical protein
LGAARAVATLAALIELIVLRLDFLGLGLAVAIRSRMLVVLDVVVVRLDRRAEYVAAEF